MLKLKNDFSNTILKNDETAKDKIELSVLMRECVYFKEKSLPQIYQLLYVVSKMQGLLLILCHQHL